MIESRPSASPPPQADWLELLRKLDLPFPWETNARGQIIMTPTSYGHSRHVGRLIQLLGRLAPDWESGSELGILTSDGVKAPEVTLASPDYHARYRDHQGYVPEAPEICVEVMSPSNSWTEMREKAALYFEVGAREVWVVDTEGRLSFFAPGDETLERSRLVPGAPASL